MQKMHKHGFRHGLAKEFLVAVFFFTLMEILNILYPMVLKILVTQKVTNDAGVLPTMSDFLISAAIVLGMLIVVFFVSLFARNRVSVFGAKCRQNARAKLYEKMTRISTSTLNEFGTSKFLSCMIEDTSWVKYKNEQYLQAAIYFIVTILGSCVLIMTMSPIYVLFIIGAVAVEIVFLFIHRAVINKRMPAAVDAYDKSFVGTRESIAGARDIRFLGKQHERSAEAMRQNKALSREIFDIDMSKHVFGCSNNMLFGIVTFGIIIFSALSTTSSNVAEQLVIVNTVLQYITLCTTAMSSIFNNIINPMTRGKIAYQRINKFLSLPETETNQGITSVDTEFGSSLVMYQVNHRFWNGRVTIENLSMELQKGKFIAFCGEVGFGRTALVKILLRHMEPKAGVVLVNGINIKEINKQYYRSKLISYCPTYPEFMTGTVRDNLRLFNPEVTDEQILATFNELGAANLAVLPSFLDTPLSVRSQLPQQVKALINVARCVLKPAEFYIFDGSFINLSNDVVRSVLKKLRAENKACLFTTVNPVICENVDEVFYAKSDHTYVKGTHGQLLLTNDDYAKFFMQNKTKEDAQ